MNISPSFPIPPREKNFSFGHCPNHLHSPLPNAKIRHSRSSGLASNQLEIPPFRQYEWNSSGSGPRACFFSSSGDWGGKTGSLLILCLKQAVLSKHYQNHINQHLYIRNIWSQKGKKEIANPILIWTLHRCLWAQAASPPTWSLWLWPSLPASLPHTSVSNYLRSSKRFDGKYCQISRWSIRSPGTKRSSPAWWLSRVDWWRAWDTQVKIWWEHLLKIQSIV